jgi:hypothetical protein
MTHFRRKSRLLLCGLLAAVIVVGITTVIVRLSLHGNITRNNYDKIRPGMAITEVETSLGAPCDDLPPLSYEEIDADEGALWTYPPPHELRFWKDNTHMISVFLDSQGRVAGKSYSRDPHTSVIRRVIDWMGW